MANGEQMAELRFMVPATWRDALAQLAHRQRISISDLLRMMVREFMRGRLTDEQRAKLEVD